MKTQPKEVNFGLSRIATLQFAILDDIFPGESEVLLNTTLNFGLGVDERIVGIKGDFKFESANRVFIKLDICCEFIIDPESWSFFLQEDRSQIIFPKGLMLHLSTILIGTARGVLHSKTEGSPYNKYMLPTINVTELVTEDIKMDIFAQPTE